MSKKVEITSAKGTLDHDFDPQYVLDALRDDGIPESHRLRIIEQACRRIMNLEEKLDKLKLGLAELNEWVNRKY